MKFENSEFFKLKHFKLEMPFGNFYFFEKFIISELNDGIHFEWAMVESMMSEVVSFYGKTSTLGYISNRVNSYSIDPRTWEKEHKKYHIIVASAIVCYNKEAYLNASLEDKMTQKNINQCFSLDEAIDWILNLKELQ